ncbi:hypothetical protein A3K34_03665 [candidate division WWE3 bacterium RIFOXYC1_FULL_40_10]|uniref:Uncharacterized protein n=1 Tax=candidate division WWE3 bacterium RIFOXYA2_FULL_46_9 TaxID=1802636 RepID=A0A1F4W326_UNCKA|nr:MAG: hypothetical protein A3K58_03665 [candidate division WWE3 bacterium RIFOXYB1_FULL_40_22]OGC61939.1 MAG: hypothetical protein A3K37_03665 [candidate division WWE3 bacterium RIFOXYA1_FULL_40_11]OGC63765.1 MAG: hypothetical protein A2264_02610 [candidate division WWE3 bacterium RIFOXYA2_FULL_46_9]OGC64496.1 MAG: hypothetical protein A2326_03805 [candidate division WWE3 bacterium RIFOXYB2_FULL_41_6]OGC66322.1 MAG: hypothetical protein A3K34_03665 [candidate division WWE3 bacterium RIFOXYC1_
MGWQSFKVHHEADCEIRGYVSIESETLAVVMLSPNLETAEMDSGVPIRKLAQAASDFAFDLVSQETGVATAYLRVEKIDGNSISIVTKCEAKFPLAQTIN